jgi:hypothetical protein
MKLEMKLRIEKFRGRWFVVGLLLGDKIPLAAYETFAGALRRVQIVTRNGPMIVDGF